MYIKTATYRAETLMHGGVLLVRNADNAEIFMQPGDDANAFENDVENATPEAFDHIASEYFACLTPPNQSN